MRMEVKKAAQLSLLGAQARRSALEMVYRATSGHLGGSMSLCEILSVLYFDTMRIDPAKPDDPDRDRFVLSKGHCTPALYSVLAMRGFFPREMLSTFRSIDGHLSGHAEMRHVPGVDMSTGSLGQGISAAVGMALAGQVDKKDYRVYAVLGDGELEEGQVWEAAMAAGNYHLDNLCVFVDNNNIQIDGTLEEIMSPYPIDKKFEAFNWHVECCDGHDVTAIAAALENAKAARGKPTVIIARTVKGKGVSFMENNKEWHGNDPDKEQYEKAAAELDALVAAAEKEAALQERLTARRWPRSAPIPASLCWTRICSAAPGRRSSVRCIPSGPGTWASRRQTWWASPPVWRPAARSCSSTPLPCSPPDGPLSRFETLLPIRT